MIVLCCVVWCGVMCCIIYPLISSTFIHFLTSPLPSSFIYSSLSSPLLSSPLLSSPLLSFKAECHNMMGSTLQALKVPDEAKEAFKESLR